MVTLNGICVPIVVGPKKGSFNDRVKVLISMTATALLCAAGVVPFAPRPTNDAIEASPNVVAVLAV